MTAALLGAVAALPEGVAVPIPVLLAAAVGLSTPPLGACVRTLLPGLLPDPSAARAAYAAESAAIELTWILGPPLALGLGAAVSTGVALAAAGAVLLAGTAAFAAEPASRAWRPEPSRERRRGGSLGSPAIRTLVIVLLAAGVLFGAVEVGVAAAASALGNSAAAGPLFGIWGAGSLLGGLVAARLGGGARGAFGLALTLAALAAGHFLLVAAAGSVLALAAALLVAGTAIAPTYASIYAMVEDAAPAGTVTEAFAWLTTAVAVGASLGVARGGRARRLGRPQRRLRAGRSGRTHRPPDRGAALRNADRGPAARLAASRSSNTRGIRTAATVALGPSVRLALAFLTLFLAGAATAQASPRSSAAPTRSPTRST